MSWNFDTVGSQKGRVAIVTGANTGLGYETALELAKLGATVVMASRNIKLLEEAARKIRIECPAADLFCEPIDLGNLASVRAFAERFLQQHNRLDLLINNAGIMMTPYQVTIDGFESQLAVNYIGHFALTEQLLSLINKTSGARIVSLSSVAHDWWKIQFEDLHFKERYTPKSAYGQSKLACLMFSYELARRLSRDGNGTLSVAAHPGFSSTGLFRQFPKPLRFFVPMISQTAREGAMPTLYAALGQDIKSGDYCGPRGLFQYWGRPCKVNSSKASKDQDVARRLWQETAKMISASEQTV